MIKGNKEIKSKNITKISNKKTEQTEKKAIKEMAKTQKNFVFQMKGLPEEYRQEIIKHYAMFLQYYYAEGPLSQLTLAHYIFLDCAVYPQKIIVNTESKKSTDNLQPEGHNIQPFMSNKVNKKFKKISNFDVFYGKSGGFDEMLATQQETSKDYCLDNADKILKEFIPNKWINKEKLINFLEGITPRDINLKMAWEVSLQNMAKAKGEFKKRLEMALQLQELKNMPVPIREINEYHIKELLEMYRLCLVCPECNFEIICLGGIALLKGGDEQILNYMQCENCSKYFISEYKEGFRENENTEAEDKCIYEIKPEQAIHDLKAIKTCPEPYNKNCKCKTHSDYFDSGS